MINIGLIFINIGLTLMMDAEIQVEIIKEKILAGSIQTFDEIFRYVEKTTIHKKIGGNYYRLLRIIRNPKLAKLEDIYLIAHALDVPARTISDLMHNQIEAAKPAAEK